MSTGRPRRVGQLLKEEVAGLLQRGLKDPLPAFTTVTDVRVGVDLKVAKVAVSVFGEAGEKEEVLEILRRSAGWIRKEVGRKIHLKYTPEFSFELDETQEKATRMNQLFEKIHQEHPGSPDPEADVDEEIE